MQQVVSITSQGQLTIPKSILKAFSISGSTKAIVEKVGEKIIVKPKNDFWSLEGSLRSSVRLSDADLRRARNSFAKDWGKSAAG